MLHLWAGAERSREFVAPLLHAKVTLTLVKIPLARRAVVVTLGVQ